MSETAKKIRNGLDFLIRTAAKKPDTRVRIFILDDFFYADLFPEIWSDADVLEIQTMMAHYHWKHDDFATPLHFRCHVPFEGNKEMDENAQEIRNGLDFLLVQAKEIDARVVTCSGHDVFRIGLRNCDCPAERVEMIYAQMKNWNWIKFTDDGLLDFSHYT